MTKTLLSEADAHILRIRADKGLDGSQIPEGIVRDLQAATKVLSDQLYAKSTRFILELIQNADDNHYTPGSAPTIEFTLSGSHLRVDCNETGFTPNNVDAICSIGRSSKAARAGYIGEKGIGFKSVFRAADVVWVASGDYNFKFDRQEKLGMIAPILEKFPAARRPGWTSYYLQLSKAYDREQLCSELKGLSSNLLLFLQRLTTIRITIEAAQSLLSRGTTSSWQTVLSKSEITDRADKMVRLQQDSISFEYILKPLDVTNMPAEEKRPGITTTQLLLAFPVDGNGDPTSESQYIYAFLPIRDYSFTFLIQADFLLSASREEIDDLLPWNRKLRDSITNAFIEAVRCFNGGPLRHAWPRYLPRDDKVRDFFRPMRKKLLQRLGDEQVIEAWDGRLAKPNSLTYVPARFRDDAGVPFTETPITTTKYVSGKYLEEDLEHLELIGVQKMDEAQFVKDLTEMVQKYRMLFVKKPASWHEQLANVINGVPEPAREAIKPLALIQLDDGSWVRGQKDDIFFPAPSHVKENVPGGLAVLVVNADIAKYAARTQLYQYLGVKYFDPAAIMDVICSLHSKARNHDLLSIAREQLVAQIRFLHANQWRNRSRQSFWVMTERDLLVRSEGLYYASDDEHSATRYFTGSDRGRFPFIHPTYLENYSEDAAEVEEWMKWLEDNLGLHRVPKLIRPLTTNVSADNSTVVKSFTMSQDFGQLRGMQRSAVTLQLVCDCWDKHYKQWLDGHDDNQKPENPPADNLAVSKKRLRAKFAEMSVATLTGKLVRLHKTFIPLPELVAEADGLLPFVDIPEPMHPRWEVLGVLGAGLQNHVGFHIACLENIRTSTRQLNRIEYFMEQIQARSNDDEAAVRAYFSESGKERIFVPTLPDYEGLTDPTTVVAGSWYKLEHCLWKGPKSLRIHACLADIYPALKRLFTDTLRVSDATMNDLMTEASHFTNADDLAYITDILIQIDKFLERDEVYMLQLEPFQRRAIWPVADPARAAGKGSPSGNPFTRLVAGNAADDWFIPDRMFLADCFAPYVPMLALSPDEVSKIRRVIKAFGLEAKLLSEAVQSEAETIGRVEFHKRYTQDLQEKYGFIARLIPVSNLDKAKTLRILRTLQDIDVFTTERVIEKYSLSHNGTRLHGQAGDGNVVVKLGDERLKIYLREGYLEEERNPDELVAKLALFCGISERREGSYMLQMVLTESDHAKIAAKLLQHGIPTIVPEMAELMREETWLTAPLMRKRLPRELDADGDHEGEGKVLTVADSGFDNGDARPFDFDQDVLAPLESKESGTSERRFRVSAIFRRKWFWGKGKLGRVETPRGNSLGDQARLDLDGQKELSDYFATTLGKDYQPDKHWTNSVRRQDGHATKSEKDISAKADFTIPSIDGQELLEVLVLPTHCDLETWAARPPTWHFIVKTTEGGLDEEFQLTAEQYNMCREFVIPSQFGQAKVPPLHVVVLARVFNLDTNLEPMIRLFVDPWSMYLAGTIQLRASGDFLGQVAV
ncbi:uncharacterized protein B0I36DRAFT_434452 [Microdochium trichocladiopsis]|uniref:Uncharacterized protein n=1 Tax=Microdochium trichocladiopsis TaxID=1682393 RepID=A0A9P8XY07_9PEZI|nr:uncharacterized protein B0I36DRAFT_434452 [Microdochium trichocladiopsis]KAH7024872.1 hypothetical protein B0I36DRAFT_434452 [Microdochium trichocladiopsis]